MRQKNTKRQNARERAKDRRDEEKQQKAEEIARLKRLKQGEIAEKLAQIKEISGSDFVTEQGAETVDLEGEFDPEAHDKQMEAMYGEEYYEGEDDKKPVFAEEEWEGEYEDADADADADVDHGWGGEGTWEDQQYNEDGELEINMDADYDPSQQVAKPKKMSRAQLKRLEAAIERGEHEDDIQNDPTLKKYMDEYYSLDYEDIVGGIPTRFKYRYIQKQHYYPGRDIVVQNNTFAAANLRASRLQRPYLCVCSGGTGGGVGPTQVVARRGGYRLGAAVSHSPTHSLAISCWFAGRWWQTIMVFVRKKCLLRMTKSSTNGRR